MEKLGREEIISALREAYNLEKTTGAGPLDEEAAWRAIQHAIDTVRLQDEIDRSTISGAERRNRCKELAQHLEASRKGISDTLKTPGLINPFVWAFGQATFGDPDMVDWEHAESELKVLAAHIETLAIWAKLAAKEASDVVARNRTPRRSTLSRLICELAPIYKRHTGRDPGRSFNPIKIVGGGPFVRFVQSVAKEMGLPLSEASIADAVKKEQSDPEWHRLFEPPQSPAEIFAGFLMGGN